MFREQPKVYNQELVDTLTRELNELPQHIRQHEEEKKEQLRLIAELRVSVKAEKQSQHALSARVETLKEELSIKREGLTSVKAKISALNDQVSDLAATISSKKERIASIRAKTPALSERIANTQVWRASLGDLPYLKEGLTAVQNSRFALTSRNAVTTLEVSSTRNKISAITDRLSTINTEISSLRRKISAINEHVYSTRAKLISAQSRSSYSRPIGYGAVSYHGQSLGGTVFSSSSVVRQAPMGGLQGHQLGRPGFYDAPESYVNPNEAEISRLRRELDSAIHDQDHWLPRYEREISELSAEQVSQESKISSYRRELASLSAEQSNQQSQIRACEIEISGFNDKLEKISSYESEILRLSSELAANQDKEKLIPSYEEEILKLNTELATAKKEQESQTPAFEKELAVFNAQISELKKKESQLIEENRGHEEAEARFESAIQEHTQQIRALDLKFPQYAKRAEELQLELAKVGQFLSTLRVQAQLLYQEVSVPLLKDLETYERLYPRNQTVAVQLCLAQLASKINFIQNLNLDAQIEGGLSNAQQSWQIKYALLCGLLWHSLEQLSGDENNRGLAKLLHSALLSMHIAENGNLPNELALRQDCVSLYRSFQQAHPVELRELAANEIISYDRKQYNKAMDNLRSTLRKIPQTSKELKELVKTGEAVANFYTDQVNILTQNGRVEQDLTEISSLLNQSAELAKTPSNAYLRLQYQEAAEKAAGHPSFGKKLGGLLLAFLGAVVTAASVLATLASFGASSPLSAAGIAIGTSIVAKGLAITGTALGLGTLAGGLGLFNSGKRKADSKVRMQFLRAAEKNNRDPGLEEESRQAAEGQLLSAPPPSYEAAVPLYPQMHPAYAPPPATNPYADGGWQEVDVKKCSI